MKVKKEMRFICMVLGEWVCDGYGGEIMDGDTNIWWVTMHVRFMHMKKNSGSGRTVGWTDGGSDEREWI